MKAKWLTLLLLGTSFLAGGSLLRVEAQIPDNEKVLMGFIDESSYYSDPYYKDKYNFLVIDGNKAEVMPSLLADKDKYGMVAAGTWVKNEFYCITWAMDDERCLYLAYEPFTQTVREIGRTSVYLVPNMGCDMAYDAQKEELYVLSASTTGSTLFKLSLTDTTSTMITSAGGAEKITIDGMVPSNGYFVGLAINANSKMYSIFNNNDNGGVPEVYEIDPATNSATSAVVVSGEYIRVSTGSNSLTFAKNTDTLYWYSRYRSGDKIYQIALSSGVAKSHAFADACPIVSIFHPEYPDGAPAPAIADLRVIKNPSDYKEATFYYTLPTEDMQGKPIRGKLRVEIWSGSSREDMQLMDSVMNQEPGKQLTYVHSEQEEGIRYFAFRVKTENGFYSSFSGIQCPFFNVSFPYRSSFEPEDEKGVAVPEGEGWKQMKNPKQNSWSSAVDTVVRTSLYAYGVENDTVSKLHIGSGLNVWAGCEYEFSCYVVGHAKTVYGGRWIEGPQKPLEVVLNGKDTTITLPARYTPEGSSSSATPYRYFTKHTYRFTAPRNEPLSIIFRAMGDDAYYIDDIEILELSRPAVPCAVADLAVKEETSDRPNRKISVSFTTPDKTMANNPLEAPVNVVVDWSLYRNFADLQGNESYVSDTLKNLIAGSAQTVSRTFGKEGFYYARAYAYNQGGASVLSSLVEGGYLGTGVRMEVALKNARNEAVSGVAVKVNPLYLENKTPYEGVSDADGKKEFTGVYVGSYEISLQHELYETYQGEINLIKDTVVNIVLKDKNFLCYPDTVRQIAFASVNHADRSLRLSWTNPEKDADGNELKELSGVIVSYQIGEVALKVLDTIGALEIGTQTDTLLVLPEQGECMLSLAAYNKAGRSAEKTIYVGYIGQGFDKTFTCKTEEGTVVKNVRITLISVNDTLKYTVIGGEDGNVRMQGVRRGTYNLYATADYYDRVVVEGMEIENDEVFILNQFTHSMQIPEIIGLSMPDETSVTFTWSLKENRNFEDGFESYPDFEIETIGEYKLGGAKGKGYFGGCTWPNILEDQSYIVMNPSATSPSIENEAEWTTHSGKKMLCSMFTVWNDDWLAHSVPGGGTLKFFAAGAQLDGTDPERFVVLYSVTDDNFGNFIKISEGQYVSTTKEWKEYSYELPENATWFAIHCVSNDASVFKLDDISYTLSHGAKIQPATGFELYVDNHRVAVLDGDETTYTFSNLPNGPHQLGLKAIYEDGASEMTVRQVNIGRQVANPINVKVREENGEYVLSYNMPSGESAQYFKVFLDGAFLENIQATSYVLPAVAPSKKHAAGVCAVNNEHFSDTVWVEFGIPSANEAMQESLFDVYPNPVVNGVVNINLPTDGKVEVFSTDGLCVFARSMASGGHELPFNYPYGVYMVSFRSADGRRDVHQVVVIK